MRTRTVLVSLALVTTAGAAVRFATLDEQSFWLDELVTVSLLRGGFDDMLNTIPKTEATPYLYYVLAWPWSRLFGFGEVGLRSLSALAGAAIVPVAYGVGAALVSRRVGLIAAALVAVNPFLVWYSQEARSYALFGLLTACSVLFFARALQGVRHALWMWAIASALALATHYFAIFLVAPEALWLLYRFRLAPRVVTAALAMGAVLLAHLPLALEQRGNAEAVATSPLASRAAGIPKALVVGFSFPAELPGSLASAALVLVALVLLGKRTPAAERGRALVAGSLAAVSVGAPVALALLGADFVVARNAIAAVVPGAVCIAAGYAANRIGVATAVALCGMSLAITLSVSLDAQFGRTDWRGAAARLQSTEVERVLVVTPFMSPSHWSPYLPGLRELEEDEVRFREVAVVGLATEGGFSAGPVEPPRGEPPAPPAGFELERVERRLTFTLALYRSGSPVALSHAVLSGLALSAEQPGVLVQDAGAGPR